MNNKIFSYTDLDENLYQSRNYKFVKYYFKNEIQIFKTENINNLTLLKQGLKFNEEIRNLFLQELGKINYNEKMNTVNIIKLKIRSKSCDSIKITFNNNLSYHLKNINSLNFEV